MQKLSCAICGPKQKLVKLYNSTLQKRSIDASTFSARRTPDRVHYQFMKCLNCGLIFSSPIMTANEISKLYEESDFFYSTEADYLKKTYGDLLKKVCTPRKCKLLDIGCGNGFFLEEARKRGVGQVFGVEPGIESVNKAPSWLKKRIKVSMFKNGLYPKESFDIVCCFHTLDHIVYPGIFLKNTRKILKKGGKALFVVHNTDGLSVKLFGEKSAIFDVEHIYLFNKSTLAKLFEQSGFKVREVIDLRNNYPLQYWLRMVPIPFKQQLLNFLHWSKIGQIPLAIKAGNICIIVE